MKKSKIFVVSLINIIFLNNIIAQDPIVMTINKRPVKKSEFEAVYRKNNVKEFSYLKARFLKQKV
jgi:hypothetical protein